MRILFFLLPALVFAQNKIEINGSTNVSSFKCVNNNPIITNYIKTSKASDVPQSILLYVKDFNCNNKKMTNDFRDMLDYKNHPTITISNSINNNQQLNKIIKSSTNIEMKGIKKAYDIELKQSSKGWDAKKSLKLSHFNLEPPRVLGGLIRVKDDVEVNIQLQK